MGKNPWTIKDGVYTLIEDTPDNRTKLGNHLSTIIKKQKGRSGIKGFKFGADAKPYRLSTKSIKELLEKKIDRVTFKPDNKNRNIAEVRPGGRLKPGTQQYEATQEITKKFTDLVSDLPGHTSENLQKYFTENDKLLRGLRDKVAKINRKLKETGKNLNQRVSRGHDQRLSQSIDSPRNLFIELLEENRGKGDRYSPNPASSVVTGNPVKEGLDSLENWKRDYITWLDKLENGGSGALAQRGDYSDLLEQRIRAIGNDAWQSLSDVEKSLVIDEVDDLITNSEKLNQFLVSEGAERSKWGILNPDQKIQAEAWINSADYRNKNFGSAVTGVGGKLGGEPVLLRKKISPALQKAVDLSKKVINAVPTPVKKLAGKATKYGLYGAGLYFASGHRELRAAEYEENPNMGNLIQKTIAQGQEQVERLDVATGGASGAVTWIPNLAGDLVDSAIETTQDPNYKRGEMRSGQWGGDVQGALDLINKMKEKELSEEEKKKNREHVDSIPNLPGFL